MDNEVARLKRGRHRIDEKSSSDPRLTNDIVVFSTCISEAEAKINELNEAGKLEDPFSTEFFVWIDAGYGHGNQSVFPFNNKWKPQFPHKKISLIKLTPIHDSITHYTIDKLYRRNLSVISGGFIAGDKR
ncbi:hypothetical protein KIN20_005811 [Parelaphostrongylus tenuis]|uniref:Uncharacterized protein n=1 Tax=Parelaphostrongylus tenuis TaxID=148309 RepID=A0AAD5QIW7_PARTN|nr:hypothetical protein KIN20_005811 [Parelaphostrongylus tenuis]